MQWSQHPGIGSTLQSPYAPDLLGISSGNFLPPNRQLQKTLDDLLNAQRDDPLVDVIPQDQLHFTFLALSPHHYATVGELPSLAPLREAFACCHNQPLIVGNLRLVALPNALILAGIPSEDSMALRQRFVDHLRKTSWATHLTARYQGGPIPPVFWHTTLIRYHATYLPAPFRLFYAQHRHLDFGEIRLPIRLLAVSYNWSVVHDLS